MDVQSSRSRRGSNKVGEVFVRISYSIRTGSARFFRQETVLEGRSECSHVAKNAAKPVDSSRSC
jgi:hypothetical protein